MGLLLINILLAVGVVVALALALLLLRHWRKRNVSLANQVVADELEGTLRHAMHLAEGRIPGRRMFLLPKDVPPEFVRMSMEERILYEMLSSDDTPEATTDKIRRIMYAELVGRIQGVFWLLNLATTVVALALLGAAVYNIITNHQSQALSFNLAALATLIVTKGGLFLLIRVLLPIAASIPNAVATAVVQKKVGEWMDTRKKKWRS